MANSNEIKASGCYIYDKMDKRHIRNTPPEIIYDEYSNKQSEEWKLNGISYKITYKIHYPGSVHQTYKLSEEWKYKDSYHRIRGPAIIRYNEFGSAEHKEWWVFGILHNEHGPAVINYYRDTEICDKTWMVNGTIHRVDGPAYIQYYTMNRIKAEYWYYRDLKFREDGPAVTEYYRNGNKRCDCWYTSITKPNKLHRLDGHAFIQYYQNTRIQGESWWIDGMKTTKFKLKNILINTLLPTLVEYFNEVALINIVVNYIIS